MSLFVYQSTRMPCAHRRQSRARTRVRVQASVHASRAHVGTDTCMIHAWMRACFLMGKQPAHEHSRDISLQTARDEKSRTCSRTSTRIAS